MKKSLFVISVFLSLILSSCSHKLPYQSIPNGVQVLIDSLNVKVQFYTNSIVRVQKWTAGSTDSKTSLMVVIDSLQSLDISVSQSNGNIQLKSAELVVKISETDGAVSYFDTDNKQIVAEKGAAAFTPYVSPNEKAWSIAQTFALSNDEAVYGLGQHQYGYMNYRGKEVKLVQTNTDAVIPFLWSTAGYGILWDNYSKTIFTDTDAGAKIWSDVADNIDYYLIADKKADKVISGYRYLTGKAPMFGKWAYGYWQSKEHYDTQAEIMAVAEKYRKLQIPIDNMIQDWDYWNGATNWSGMFFDKTLFPRPQEMMDKLHAMNYHAIISIWPALGPNTPIYKEMNEKGFLYKPVGWAGFKYYDAFNPEATKLYYQYLKSGLWCFGLDGWWIDSTEPDVTNALTKESTDYEMKNKVGKNHLGSWDRYLNAFSLIMTTDLHKLMRADATQRQFILTRSTYAGQQRNAAVTWSGDIGAAWDIYKHQIAAGLNHSMSGVPYWTFDIGAFVLGAYDGVFCNGGKDPAYQELYTRMFQLGVFTPIFRSHGSETPREIWEFGEFIPTLIKFDNLRYRLMPYIYSQAWKITNEDYTIMRGLAMDYTDDKRVYNIDDQFMFGPSLMACPVTEHQKYTPPLRSIAIPNAVFKTAEGNQGLHAQFFKDKAYKNIGADTIVSNVDVFWYTGRPSYVTDSMFSIRWNGTINPTETGPYQFHLQSFDAKRIRINGKQLKMVYTSVEQYTEVIQLEAGKSYTFELETENTSTGAARMVLKWKTPSLFAAEKVKETRKTTREVYLPKGIQWVDFWTGKTYNGGTTITADARIETMPLYVPAGSIIPMGPFVQYTTEKPYDNLEIRIYKGANGTFSLYEDENDGYNYEKGIYSTIDFAWNNSTGELTIGARKGSYPGMLQTRTFSIVVVSESTGTGIETAKKMTKVVDYKGKEIVVKL
ncbi:MAG: Alpha-xylosidase [Bacteroidetes bacterium ADurb.Bin217]|nr:MAG: Alpha-xylosidase [Bacteroidetes bacterium ADurb.Bin217]